MNLNSIRPWRNIDRRSTRKIMVGSVPVGADSPITVQTMTNTLTTDIKSTINQIISCADAGADIIRVSCPDLESTKSLKTIVKESPIPIVADIHFHYKRAIEAAEAGAACLRINPGNIGSNIRVKEVIKAAKDFGCSIRIGVNAGSLEKELLEKYGEPWERRGPLIQDILNELFLDPVDLRTYAMNELSLKQREQLEGYAIDHGIDIIGDERE